MVGHKVKGKANDDNNARAFYFTIESQKKKVKLGIEGCKKGESDKVLEQKKRKK